MNEKNLCKAICIVENRSGKRRAEKGDQRDPKTTQKKSPGEETCQSQAQRRGDARRAREKRMVGGESPWKSNMGRGRDSNKEKTSDPRSKNRTERARDVSPGTKMTHWITGRSVVKRD